MQSNIPHQWMAKLLMRDNNYKLHPERYGKLVALRFLRDT